MDVKAAAGSIFRDPTMFLGTVDATIVVPLVEADRSDLRLEKVILITNKKVDAHDTNYWTFQVTNKEADAGGTDELMAAAITTKITGGTAIAAYVPYELDMDQNQEISMGDVLVLTLTKAAAAADIEGLTVQLQYRNDL